MDESRPMEEVTLMMDKEQRPILFVLCSWFRKMGWTSVASIWM